MASTTSTKPVPPAGRKQPLETVRAEDYIEYYLFPAGGARTPNDNQPAGADADSLEQLAGKVTEIAAQFGSNYIWHKDGFRVTPRFGDAQLLAATANGTNADASDAPAKADSLPGHLYGITYFDDNIQDEWFVLALLFELTRRVDGLIVRVVDADGEFVLIEAAEHLPGWANPETCAEKIFIHAGHLHLVNTTPNEPPAATTIAASLDELRSNAAAHRMSAAVQACIAARIVDFPGNIAAQLHRQNVYVPLPAAALLKVRPQLVAAAVRAFCQRDPVDMRACRAMRHFPPENRVRTAVTFTRYLYAQLTHSAYAPDRRTGWNLPPAGHAQHTEHLLGVKLACGFEILAAQASTGRTSNKTEDDGLATNRQWLEYVRSLEERGYFQELLAGSVGHQRLLASAKEYFRTHVSTTSTFGTEAGDEIVQLLKQLDLDEADFKAVEKKLPPSDDDSWLTVSAEELDAMLATRYGIKKSVRTNGDNANANGIAAAAELTGNISEFLEQKSEWDGVQVGQRVNGKKPRKTVKFGDDVAPGDDTVHLSTAMDFNPDDFSRHVQEMLDLVIPEDDWESQSDMSDFENDADLEANIERMASNGKTMKAYMDEMDAELAKTTIGKSFQTKKRGAADDGGDAEEEEAFDDIENFEAIDIDANTLTNMAQSYRSQLGGPGPTSSLLGSMGIRVNPEEGGGATGEADAKLYQTQV